MARILAYIETHPPSVLLEQLNTDFPKPRGVHTSLASILMSLPQVKVLRLPEGKTQVSLLSWSEIVAQTLRENHNAPCPVQHLPLPFEGATVAELMDWVQSPLESVYLEGEELAVQLEVCSKVHGEGFLPANGPLHCEGRWHAPAQQVVRERAPKHSDKGMHLHAWVRAICDYLRKEGFVGERGVSFSVLGMECPRPANVPQRINLLALLLADTQRILVTPVWGPLGSQLSISLR